MLFSNQGFWINLLARWVASQFEFLISEPKNVAMRGGFRILSGRVKAGLIARCPIGTETVAIILLSFTPKTTPAVVSFNDVDAGLAVQSGDCFEAMFNSQNAALLLEELSASSLPSATYPRLKLDVSRTAADEKFKAKILTVRCWSVPGLWFLI